MSEVATEVGTPLRQFYLLRGVGSFANNLLQFVVPVLAFQQTGNVGWAGVALFVEWVPRLASLPVAGPLVDRFGVRPVYLASDVVRAGAGLLVVGAYLLTDGVAALLAVIGLALVAGACFEQTFIAGEKAVKLLATSAQIPRAQSVLGGIDQAMILVAPVAGGLLLVFAESAAIALIGALFLTSLLIVARLPRLAADAADRARDTTGTGGVADQGWDTTAGTGAAGRGRLRPGELIGQIVAGVRRVWQVPILRYVVAVTVLVNLLLGIVFSATPAVVLGRYGRPESDVGLLYTAAGIASVAVLAVTPRVIVRFGLLRVGVATAMAGFLAIALVGAAGQAGATTGFGLFALLVTGFLVVDSVFTVFIRTVRARVVPAAEFGVVTGAIVLLNFASMPVAGLAVAATAWTGLSSISLFAGSGVVCLLAGAALLRRLALLMPQRRSAAGQWFVPAIGDEDEDDCEPSSSDSGRRAQDHAGGV